MNLKSTPSRTATRSRPAKKNIIHEITIDNVLFGCENGILKVFLIRHGGGSSKGLWGLPGDWLRRDEDLDYGASRILLEKTGLKNVYLEQLHAFGNVDRITDDRVITIAYYALIRPNKHDFVIGASELDANWFDVKKIPKLIYDHRIILNNGIERLKQKVRYEPIGFNLLPEKFTLFELQKLYEAILDISLSKSNFRRKIMNMNLLVPCNEKQESVAHRAAYLFRFDPKVYKKLTKKGFSFEF